MATTATNVMYEIGDGTGYIETRQWLDSEADEQGKTAGIAQDKYVSVIGTLKKFNDKLHVSAQQIRPVENPDEVYNHLLKALAVSLSYRNPAANGVSCSVRSRYSMLTMPPLFRWVPHIFNRQYRVPLVLVVSRLRTTTLLLATPPEMRPSTPTFLLSSARLWRSLRPWTTTTECTSRLCRGSVAVAARRSCEFWPVDKS